MATLSLTSSLSIATPFRRRSDLLSPSLALPSRISSPPSQCGRGRLTITCVRVGGVEIPNDKRLEYSLQHIYGIGRTRSKLIINALQFPNKVTRDLTEEELTVLRKEVARYMIEGDLRRYTARRIDNLKKMRCFRGRMHARRARRGKRVTMKKKKKTPGGPI
ncbi:small ribosomal subunit protein uS13c-like [Carex rostrata]